MLGHGTSVFGDLGEYVRSLKKMKELRPGVCYPGHGAVCKDGTGVVEGYLVHRERREGQVVGVLRGRRDDKGGWVTARECVEEIYKGVDEGLWGAAEMGVRQVLGKLEQEGTVGRKEEEGVEKWRLVVGRGESL